VDLSLFAQFWLISLLLALTPGADWAFVIAAGVRGRSLTSSVLGILLGHALLIVIAALGVGALIARYPLALTALTIVGALYLLWLGSTTLFRPARGIEASSEPARRSAGGAFMQGAGISAINPKGLLLLLALLPQFTSPSGWTPFAQMIVLGSSHLANCAVVYFAAAHLARRVLHARPSAMLFVTRLSGVAMSLIGLAVIGEQIVKVV